MKKNATWIIEVKDIKIRKHFAPPTKKFKNKKAYSRKSFKMID